MIEITKTYLTHIQEPKSYFLKNDGNKRTVKVIKRVKGNNGNPVGTQHNKPMLDTSEYTVEMYDGSPQELTDNIIAEQMFAQIDSEGHHYQLLQDITDHRKDWLTRPISDGMICLRNGNMVSKKTTQGWDLLMEWKDGSSRLTPLNI